MNQILAAFWTQTFWYTKVTLTSHAYTLTGGWGNHGWRHNLLSEVCNGCFLVHYLFHEGAVPQILTPAQLQHIQKKFSGLFPWGIFWKWCFSHQFLVTQTVFLTDSLHFGRAKKRDHKQWSCRVSNDHAMLSCGPVVSHTFVSASWAWDV